MHKSTVFCFTALTALLAATAAAAATGSASVDSAEQSHDEHEQPHVFLPNVTSIRERRGAVGALIAMNIVAPWVGKATVFSEYRV